MQKIANRIPTLAWAPIVLGLGLFGWVTNATPAQDPRQEIPARTPAAKPANSSQSPAEDLEVPTIKAEPANSNLSNPGLAVEARPSPTESALEPIQVSPRSSLEEVAATTDNAPGATSAAYASADPEKAALAFLAENQKLAESQLKNLRDEESKLKARLAKVQAGIKRWESLVEALKQSKESVAVVIPGAVRSWVESGPDPAPQHLDPVVPTTKNPVVTPK
jgi:hypothetical protein